MTNFFYFDEISKMRVLQPKNALLKGAKNHRVKKVIKSKNDFSKSCPKFCKLGDEFFLFWRNLKNEAATAEKRYFDNVYYIHNKSCIFSPGAPKNQNYDEKFYRHAHIAYTVKILKSKQHKLMWPAAFTVYSHELMSSAAWLFPCTKISGRTQ